MPIDKDCSYASVAPHSQIRLSIVKDRWPGRILWQIFAWNLENNVPISPTTGRAKLLGLVQAWLFCSAALDEISIN